MEGELQKQLNEVYSLALNSLFLFLYFTDYLRTIQQSIIQPLHYSTFLLLIFPNAQSLYSLSLLLPLLIYPHPYPLHLHLQHHHLYQHHQHYLYFPLHFLPPYGLHHLYALHHLHFHHLVFIQPHPPHLYAHQCHLLLHYFHLFQSQIKAHFMLYLIHFINLQQFVHHCRFDFQNHLSYHYLILIHQHCFASLLIINYHHQLHHHFKFMVQPLQSDLCFRFHLCLFLQLLLDFKHHHLVQVHLNHLSHRYSGQWEHHLVWQDQQAMNLLNLVQQIGYEYVKL